MNNLFITTLCLLTITGISYTTVDNYTNSPWYLVLDKLGIENGTLKWEFPDEDYLDRDPLYTLSAPYEQDENKIEYYGYYGFSK